MRITSRITAELSEYTFRIQFIESWIYYFIKMTALQPLDLFWNGVYIQMILTVMYVYHRWCAAPLIATPSPQQQTKGKPSRLKLLPESLQRMAQETLDADTPVVTEIDDPTPPHFTTSMFRRFNNTQRI